jgi:hypothetical protein
MNLHIDLNQNLEIFVEEGGLKTSIFLLKRTKHTLELSEHFEQIWSDLYQEYAMESVENIYYTVGEFASFTDTRVIFIWLKSWQYFNPNKNYFLQGKEEKNPVDINYLKAPRITIKESLQ